MSPTMGIEASQHGGSNVLFSARFAATRGMRIEQIFLVFLDLLRREDDFGKLSDCGVHAVHNFLRCDLALQQCAALVDARYRIRMQFNWVSVACNCSNSLDGQRMSVQNG